MENTKMALVSYQPKEINGIIKPNGYPIELYLTETSNLLKMYLLLPVGMFPTIDLLGDNMELETIDVRLNNQNVRFDVTFISPTNIGIEHILINAESPLENKQTIDTMLITHNNTISNIEDNVLEELRNNPIYTNIETSPEQMKNMYILKKMEYIKANDTTTVKFEANVLKPVQNKNKNIELWSDLMIKYTTRKPTDSLN